MVSLLAGIFASLVLVYFFYTERYIGKKEYYIIWFGLILMLLESGIINPYNYIVGLLGFIFISSGIIIKLDRVKSWTKVFAIREY